MKLSARVEALTGPDREVDALIELAFGPRPDWIAGANGHIYSPNKGDVVCVSAYTASVDAAMTLVPEGLDVTMGRTKYPWCNIWTASGEKTQERISGAEALTLPLAIAAAALKARNL